MNLKKFNGLLIYELIFGTAPRVDIAPRYIYEIKEESFYNF